MKHIFCQFCSTKYTNVQGESRYRFCEKCSIEIYLNDKPNNEILHIEYYPENYMEQSPYDGKFLLHDLVENKVSLLKYNEIGNGCTEIEKSIHIKNIMSRSDANNLIKRLEKHMILS